MSSKTRCFKGAIQYFKLALWAFQNPLKAARIALEHGELLLLEAVCAVGGRIHRAGGRLCSAVCPYASCYLEQRVFMEVQIALVYLGIFNLKVQYRLIFLSYRLFKIRHLLLHGGDLGVVQQETVMRLVQQDVDGGDLGCGFVEVPNANGRFAKLPGAADCRADGSDK